MSSQPRPHRRSTQIQPLHALDKQHRRAILTEVRDDGIRDALGSQVIRISRTHGCLTEHLVAAPSGRH
ncbi:MAG: hypothetical protein HOW97_40020 [Catenulispora sp.]|nr:hypothetical protein [Catenulispora sp.]